MLDDQHTKMQRAHGVARLGFVRSGDQHQLSDLYQAGCLKLMLPRNHAPVPDAVMINTAGGLTGGDQLKLDVTVGDGAALRLATQTAERIYQSTSDAARVSLSFDLGMGAQFDWLAQETILFNRGRVKRSINADIASGASLLIVEPIVLGRSAMGETVQSGLLHDHWRIKREGDLVFADATKLMEFGTLNNIASLGTAQCMATILWVDPMAEAACDTLRDLCDQFDWIAGVSAWNGLLTIRAVADDPRQIRGALQTIMKTIRGRDIPRVWTI